MSMNPIYPTTPKRSGSVRVVFAREGLYDIVHAGCRAVRGPEGDLVILNEDGDVKERYPFGTWKSAVVTETIVTAIDPLSPPAVVSTLLTRMQELVDAIAMLTVPQDVISESPEPEYNRAVVRRQLDECEKIAREHGLKANMYFAGGKWYDRRVTCASA